VGCCVGAFFGLSSLCLSLTEGGYTVLRYGGGQAGILRTWGKYVASSAATFGYLPAPIELTKDSSWYTYPQYADSP